MFLSCHPPPRASLRGFRLLTASRTRAVRWPPSWGSIRHCKVGRSPPTLRARSDWNGTRARGSCAFAGRWTVCRPWQATVTIEYFVAGTAVPGIDGLRVLPSIKVGDPPLAPIISWWALLFAASMMARYEPDAWVETLRVDYSPLAAPIEALLEAALSQVPTLILSCLSEPTQLLPELAP